MHKIAFYDSFSMHINFSIHEYSPVEESNKVRQRYLLTSKFLCIQIAMLASKAAPTKCKKKNNVYVFPSVHWDLLGHSVTRMFPHGVEKLERPNSSATHFITSVYVMRALKLPQNVPTKILPILLKFFTNAAILSFPFQSNIYMTFCHIYWTFKFFFLLLSLSWPFLMTSLIRFYESSSILYWSEWFKLAETNQQ